MKGLRLYFGDAKRLTYALGPCLFILIVVGGMAAVIFGWGELTLGDYLQAVGAGAGLMAVGHGIHRVAEPQT